MSLLANDARFAGPALRVVPTVAAHGRPPVFLVHEDESTREGLVSQARSPDWQLEAFASAMDFLALAPAQGPCCLVVDVALPGLRGLQKRVSVDWTGTPIILVRGHGDVVTTIQVGDASGAAPAAMAAADDLSGAIAQALAHSAMLLRHAQRIRTLQRRYALLSARERQVMTLVATGLLNKQVAHELGISEITVKAHRGRLTRKMEARSIADLIRMAAGLRLIGWH